jgi:medium-chain acyl-[acyl-carrier-protein] hydrolase
MKAERRSRWVLSLRASDAIERRVFCFPYAGGGASIYRRWAASAHEGVEFCAIQLPGHEDRLSERPLSHVSDLIPLLLEQLAPQLDRPFAFFGHSMGAVIAFELARALHARGGALPVHLFLSGRRAPHLPDKRRPIHDLTQAEFELELRRLDGTPREVLQDPEVMELMMPVLRADFAICDTHVYTGGPPLDVPITAFGGTDDPETDPEALEAWRAYTRAFCGVKMFPGNHFFLHEHANALARAVQESFTTSPTSSRVP